MIGASQLLLYGVFRTLVDCKVSLGVADYLDAIRALQFQIAESSGRPTRNDLRRLCQILWARDSGELRLIETIFKSIPQPPQDEIDSLDDLIRDLVPIDSDLSDSQAIEKEAPADRTDQAGSQTSGDPSTLAIEVQSPREAGGVPLPYPRLPFRGGETFVMQPQTVVSPRTLAVLWRRYRRMVRTGPPTEVDLNATIVELCQRGVIARPVLRPMRINRAKLLILADVSPSMVAWRPFLGALAQSLALSRLPAAAMFYFSNVPKRALFRTAALTRALPADEVFESHKGAGLLIVSDAGAARGYFNRPRVERTRALINAASKRMRAVVWINPMPQPRWKGTTAEALASERTAVFLPLGVPSLIRAVDILRGAKSH